MSPDFAIDAVPLTSRPLTTLELPLVFSSWIKPLRRQNDLEHEEWARRHIGQPPVAKRLYCDGLHRQIELLLSRPNTFVLGALGPDDLTVLGFIVGERSINSARPTIHWVSVKEPYRNSGIATRLLAKVGVATPLDRPITVSFRTPSWSAFAKRINLEWVYDPYQAICQ